MGLHADSERLFSAFVRQNWFAWKVPVVQDYILSATKALLLQIVVNLNLASKNRMPLPTSSAYVVKMQSLMLIYRTLWILYNEIWIHHVSPFVDSLFLPLQLPVGTMSTLPRYSGEPRWLKAFITNLMAFWYLTLGPKFIKGYGHQFHYVSWEIYNDLASVNKKPPSHQASSLLSLLDALLGIAQRRSNPLWLLLVATESH